jgi:putative transposase
MSKDSTTGASTEGLFAGDAWFDPIEAGLRGRIRGFIEAMLEEELAAALGGGRYERGHRRGHRHGRRERQLLGSFGPTTISVPRGRLSRPDGTTEEWRSAALPRYARMTRQVAALIAASYLAGTNTRRVRRALGALFRGAVGKDVVSRTWRRVKADWEGWNRRSLAGDDIVRLILDGTVVRVRLDRKATSVSLLVVLGVRSDGQKVLLSVRAMGGESEAAWRGVLDDLIARGLRTPGFLIIDGAAGLERALAALWPAVPTQRCTVHTIRTQSAVGPCRAVVAWTVGGSRRWAQRDNMMDLEAAVADDDAFDDELQDRLFVGERHRVQARADALAKCRQVGPHRFGAQALLA